MIRWTFYFDQGSVHIDTKNEADDYKLSTTFSEGRDSYVLLPGEKIDLYVNLNLVKCASREILTEEQAQVPEPACDLHPQGVK